MRPATAGLRLVSADDLRRRSVEVDSHDLVWVDLGQPTEEDLAWLERTFRFHPLALEDVRLRHQRAKLEEYPDYYFGVLYAVRTDATQRRVRTAELQFFWGATYLVTLHAEPFPEIDHLADLTRSDSLAPVVGDDTHEASIADLAYRLIDAVVDTYFPAVDALAEWSEAIESGMFASRTCTTTPCERSTAWTPTAICSPRRWIPTCRSSPTTSVRPSRRIQWW